MRVLPARRIGRSGTDSIGMRLALVLAALALFASAAPAAAGTRAVVELFTSQGCNSCPPADALLAKYAARDDVLALSFNVDIWDRLGWKDTLASHENTERQRAYAVSRGDGNVYTPQVVIDGREHAVGSDERAIEAAIASQANQLTVPVTMTPSDDAVTVSIGAAPGSDTPHATLWVVMYDRSDTVAIDHGENSGRTITYSNVVRKLRPVAMWKGEAMTIDLPRSEMERAGVRRCAVLLQTEREGLPGPIIGAAALPDGL